MKVAKICWISGSILINVVIAIYIGLIRKAPIREEERFQYINDNWDIFSAHWKAEFILMILIAIGAFYFALYFKKISWSIITIGQLITILTYPIMLGGYYDSTFEIQLVANEMATVVFLVGNIFFFGGLVVLYIEDAILVKWLRILAISLAAIGVIAMFGAFIGFYPWKTAMKIGPLITLLYLINAYYGFRLENEKNK
jgi:hypothetical protein